MQISVESTSALERKMTVQIPAAQIEQEVKNRLESMSRTARIDGFRPGKVPIKVIESKFGNRVRKEVMDQVVQSTLDEAIAQEKMEPAGTPAVQVPDALGADGVLEYVAIFEVYPELDVVQLGDAAIDKPVAEVTDDNIATVLDKLRKQQTTWTPVERAAEQGDRLTVTYEAAVGGQSFPGNKGKNVVMELGSEAIVDGFDEQLVGASAGENRSVVVTFPDNHMVAEIAGKQAEFDVRIVAVAEGQLPDLNNDLAKKFGVGDAGLDGLKKEVQANMTRELEQSVRAIMKERVFNILADNNNIDVPAVLVADEAKRMASVMAKDVGKIASDEDIMELARRRILLGFLITKLVKDNAIEVDPMRVRSAVELIATTYEKPSEVVAWYYDNPDQLKEAEGLVLEDQVVDWVLEQLATTDKPMSFDEVLQLRQQTST